MRRLDDAVAGNHMGLKTRCKGFHPPALGFGLVVYGSVHRRRVPAEPTSPPNCFERRQ